MQNMFKKIIAFTTALTLMFSFCACEEGANIIFEGDDDSEIEYTYSETVNIPIEKLRTLNPLLSKDKDMYYISKLVFDGLFVLDSQLVPQKALTESYSYNDDMTELTITLKRGVKWHDGETLTAKDVEFSIDVITNLAHSGDGLYASHVSNIRSVVLDRDNEYKFTIRFFSSENTGIENFIFPIIPSHTFRSASRVKADSDDFEMIGTGAYKMASYDDIKGLLLIPNENYRAEIPENQINFVILPNSENAIGLTDNGEISLLFNESMSRDTMLSRHKVTLESYVSNKAEVIGFNFRNPHMARSEVRKAIAYATDTESIISSAYYKNAVTSDTLFYPGYYGSENRGDQYSYNLAEARGMLSDAGYVDYDGNGYIENRLKQELSIAVLVNSSDSAGTAAAAIIKSGLDKLGIFSVIDACDDESYYAKIAAGEFDMYIGCYEIDERYDLRPILHSQGGNNIGYGNQTLDGYLEALSSGISVSEKQRIIEDTKDMLINELPYYCMFYKTYGCFVSEYFEGELDPVFNNIYNGIINWRCKYPEKNF